MFNPEFDLRKQAVLERKPGLNLDKNVNGTAKIVSYTPDRIEISTNSSGNSLLFLSDTFYPGWKALVDGKNTTIYRTDFTFRSVFVPGRTAQS